LLGIMARNLWCTSTWYAWLHAFVRTTWRAHRASCFLPATLQILSAFLAIIHVRSRS
jgi:hypothetical protein